MQHRTFTNSVLTVTGLFSFTGWLGPRILKLINFVQTADGLREMMNLVAIKDVSISWPGIYLFGFIASCVGIIAINLDWAQKYYRRKRDGTTRVWDMNGCDAISYIITSSQGTTFPESIMVKLAADAFYQAAKTEKIRVAGMPEGSAQLDNIPKRTWNGKNILDHSACGRAQIGGCFSLDGRTKKKSYIGD